MRRLVAQSFALGVSSFAPADAASLLVRNATPLTMEADQEDSFFGYMIVDADDRITDLRSGEPPAGTDAATEFDAAGRVVMPGFLSGHSHLQARATRRLNAERKAKGPRSPTPWRAGVAEG